MIGATTENPYITINPAIRSRTQIFEVKPLTETDIQQAIQEALTDSTWLRRLSCPLRRKSITTFDTQRTVTYVVR